MLSSLAREFFQRSRVKRKNDLLPVHSNNGRSGSTLGDADTEVSTVRARVFGREALHTAVDDEEGPEPSSEQLLLAEQAPIAKVMDKHNAAIEYIEEILRRHDAEGDRARLANEDEEEALVANAKKEILHATSNADLLLKAELLIGEDWLGKIDMINGNIYRIGAFAGLIDISQGGKRTRCAGVARMVGCGLIFILQVLGPLLIFLSCVFGWGREFDKFYHWENWWLVNHDTDVDMFYDWKTTPTTKLLGMCFLEAFILNALFVTQDERKAEEKVWDIFGHLKRNTPNYEVHGSLYLFMGSFVNNWLVVVCTLDAYMIIGASRTPSDLLLDSLALLFLFNLDDVGGDLGFVDEDDWPGDRIAWIHSEIVQAPSEDDELNMDWKEKFNRYTNMALYTISFYFCCMSAVVMPIAAVLTPFLKIAPAD